MTLNTIPLSTASLNSFLNKSPKEPLRGSPKEPLRGSPKEPLCGSLKEFLWKYGSDTTTNFDLKKIAKDLQRSSGGNLQIKVHIIMCDEINNYLDKENLIINLQTSKEKGSHWVLCSKKFKIYFDSYGVVPIKNIDTYLDKGSFIYNTIQVQKINTKICGQLCLFVLDKLEGGSKFEDIVLSLCE